MTRPFSPCLPRLFALRQSRTLHDIPYRPCLRLRPSTIPNVTLPSIPASTRRNLPCQYAVCLNYRSSPASTLRNIPPHSIPRPTWLRLPPRSTPCRSGPRQSHPLQQFQAICLIKQSQIIQSLIPPIALNQVALLQFQLVVQPLQLNSQCRLPLAFQRHI